MNNGLKFRRILVIEEDEKIQGLIRDHSGENNYQLIWAGNQAEMVLHLLEDAELGAVLISEQLCDSDFDILKEIKKINPYVRIIIVAENWDLASVRRAMHIGVYDYMTYAGEKENLINSVDHAIEQSFSRIAAARTRQNLLSLQRELEIAGDVQNYILPQQPLENGRYKIHARIIPTRTIGGDFYDYFIIDDHHVGIVIGDVSGKGIPAALFMAMTRSLIKMNALSEMTPHECLSRVNIALSKDNPSCMFATVFYALLNTDSGKMAYCNAGHEAPYVIGNDGGVKCLEGTGGMALGFDESIQYLCRETKLEPGEMVILFTDGVTEAADKNNFMYGKERLEKKIRCQESDAPERLLNNVLEDLDSFSSGAAQTDDITMLTLTAQKQGATAESGQVQPVIFTLKNNIVQLTVLQEKIEHFCVVNDMPFALQHALEMSLEELFTNIINYSYVDKKEHHIRFALRTKGSSINIEITDDGRPFDPTAENIKKEKVSLEQSTIGGWGLQIVRKYMDALTYRREDSCNILTLIKNI